MQYIPIITLVLVVILLGLVIVLLTRKPEKPELPQQIDPTASITALGTLVTQNLREGREAQSNQLSAMDKSLGDKMSGLTDQLGRFETRLQGFTAETTQNLTNIRETVDKNLHTFTGETKQNLETIRSTMDKNLHTFTGETKQDLETIRETVDKNLHTFTGETKQDLENIRVTVDKNLRAMQEDNNKKLDDMRQIVDEKLQKTLSERMNESFKLVNERLEQVYKGLGEMQTLAQGVGDLKKVLTNVKTRGIVGEIQLGAILEDILAPEQYETNVATVPNSRNVVEYAVKLPVEDGSFVWLPIDSKFPGDTYGALRDAYEEGSREQIDACVKQLIATLKSEGEGQFTTSILHRRIRPSSASCSCPSRDCTLKLSAAAWWRFCSATIMSICPVRAQWRRCETACRCRSARLRFRSARVRSGAFWVRSRPSLTSLKPA